MKLRGLFIAALLLLSQLTLAQGDSGTSTDSTDTTAILTNTANTGNIEIYEGLVLGIGKGTLTVAIFAIFAVIVCLFRDCSSTPNAIVGCAILLPIIVLIIIVALPKKSLKTDKIDLDAVPTDNYLLTKLLITIGMGVVTCLLLCVNTGLHSVELIA